VTAGQRLRHAREQCGLTLRELESASEKLVRKYGSDEYLLSASRVSDFEVKNTVPSVHKLYSFAVLYDLDYAELLSWYGIDLSRARQDVQLTPPRLTHRTSAALPLTIRVPLVLDPAFDSRRTANFVRFVQQWGAVPTAYLEEMVSRPFTYVLIGAEDRTMYPLITPGSFVQVDESQEYVVSAWRSEYERPVYLVETRDQLICCWCELQGDKIILQSHPLSQVPVRVMNHPQDAEIVGRVVGIAMSLSAREHDPSRESR
jgi:transcriptional regulator with XRE-family HTH domain